MKVLRILLLAAVVGGPLLAVASGLGLLNHRTGQSLEDLGSPAVAKALAERAAAMVREDGREKALQEISNPKSELVQGSLYVFAMSLNGTMLANPHHPKLIGKSFLSERDFNGVAYGRELVNTARTDSVGWVDYIDTEPMSRKLRRKSTYVLRVDNLFVACGYYMK